MSYSWIVTSNSSETQVLYKIEEHLTNLTDVTFTTLLSLDEKLG